MNILYLDLFAGISGDMTLGAFMDLGVREEVLIEGFKKLGIEDEYKLKISPINKNGIMGTKVDIIIEDEHNHDGHLDDESDHHHHHHHHHHHSHDRNLEDIENLIDNSSLSLEIKEISKKIFRYVAKAESKIHGMPIEKVHFHEVGATDSILDIVGTAICLNELDVDKVIGSYVHTGTGFVHCQHGWIPVPVPATMEILREEKIPYYGKGIKQELVTPTGAAILAGIVDEFGPMPSMESDKIGYGAGSRNSEIPNMLRMILGKKKQMK